MKIIRNEQEFELTEQELQEAHREFVTDFIENELLENFDVEENEIQSIAKAAYDRYCEGNGETEYQCIEWAYENFQEKKKETEKS